MTKLNNIDLGVMAASVNEGNINGRLIQIINQAGDGEGSRYDHEGGPSTGKRKKISKLQSDQT